MAGLMFHAASKFRAVRSLETDALTGWRAAYTGSEHCVIPEGTVLQLRRDAGGVEEPRRQVWFEPLEPPAERPYIGAIFPAAVQSGLFPNPENEPWKWRKVEHLTSLISCVAENHDELERQLIPDSTRTAPKY